MKKFLSYIVLIFCLTLGQSVLAQVSSCFTADVTRGCAPLTIKITDCSGVKSFAGLPQPQYQYNFTIGGPISTTTDTFFTYTTPGTYTILQVVSCGTFCTTNRCLGSCDSSVRVNYIEVLPSPTPVFSVRRCIGSNVILDITDTNYDEYFIDFGDGSPVATVLPSSSTPHVYATTTAKTITVTGNYNPGSCGASSNTNIIPFGALIQPDMHSLAVLSQSATSGQIRFTFNAISYLNYKVLQKINTGAYVPIDTLTGLNGITNITYTNLNTLNDQYCYMLSAFDDCANEVQSVEICSNIITTTALNNQNQIDWSDYSIPGSNLNNYSLFKDGVLLATTTALTYTDNAVQCGTSYCYQIIANLNSSNNLNGATHTSTSVSQCVTAISTNIPPAVQNLNSSIENNTVRLVWDPGVSPQQYQVFRSQNGSGFSNSFNTSTNTSNDTQADVNNNEYCYYITYTDLCNNTSPASNTSCPVLLRVFKNNNTNDLSWNAYSGFNATGISNYTIEILDNNNNVISSINNGSGLNYIDLINPSATEIRYRIRINPNGIENINPSYSNIVEIKFDPLIFIPEAFTPDGDGVNDVLTAKGKYFKNFKFTVFNKWGEIVFFTDNINNGWDGIYRGSPAPMDAYAFRVDIEDNAGKTLTKRGSVTLLR